MRKLSDDVLQSLLEEGLKPEQSALTEQDKNDLETYQILFQVLKQEPKEGPSHSLSNKVRLALQAEIKVKNARKFYFSMGAVVFLCVGMALGLLIFIDESYQTDFLHMAWSGKWIFVFSFVLLFIIQYMDQKMLSSKFEHQQR